MATIVTLEGSLDKVVRDTYSHLSKGYIIHKEWSAVNWPFFWQKRYFVTLIGPSPIRPHFLDAYFNGPRNSMLDVMDEYAPAGISPLNLEYRLQQAIEQENYELAAELRDMINKAK